MTVVQKLPGVSFGDETLRRRGATKLLTGGTLHSFDFSNVACYATQADPIVTGITDLSPNAKTGARTNTAGTLHFTGGGMAHDTNTGQANMRFTDAIYNVSALQAHEWLINCWLKPGTSPASGFMDNYYGLQDTGGARADTDNPFNIGVSNSGFYMLNNAGTPEQLFPYDLGVVTQIAYHLVYDQASGKLSLGFFKNGVKIGVIPLTWRAWSAPASACACLLHGGGLNYSQPTGTVYAGFIEDVTVSQVDPEEWIALDYALNNGRFT